MSHISDYFAPHIELINQYLANQKANPEPTHLTDLKEIIITTGRRSMRK